VTLPDLDDHRLPSRLATNMRKEAAYLLTLEQLRKRARSFTASAAELLSQKVVTAAIYNRHLAAIRARERSQWRVGVHPSTVADNATELTTNA
jgi:hypothetical protein